MNKLFEMKFGSHLYGTSTPASDVDYKSIYLPTAREIVLGDYHKTINMSRKKDHGDWLLCGHVHGAWAQMGKQINVGVDVRNYQPISELEIISIIESHK